MASSLTLGWTAAGVGFAALLRRSGRDEHAALLAGGGLGAHIALGLATALMVDDTRAVLAGDEALSIAGMAATAMLAAGCLTSARIVGEGRRVWRTLLDATGLLALALLTALMLDGEALALAWAAQALALITVAKRYDDRVAACGALGFLALASAHALVYEAAAGRAGHRPRPAADRDRRPRRASRASRCSPRGGCRSCIPRSARCCLASAHWRCSTSPRAWS